MSAPSTNKRWIEDFIVALRLRGVRGEAIGDAVAVVRGHLADSGEQPAVAFGDPIAYAGQLDLPTSPGVRPTDPVIMGPAISLLALLAFAPAIAAAFDGQPLEFSLPQLLLYVVPLAAVLALPWYFGIAMRHVWLFAVAFSFSVLASTGSSFLAPARGLPVIASLDPVWAAVASGTLLLTASTWAIVDGVRSASDTIIDPASQGPSPASAAAAERKDRIAAVVPHLLMPLVALACLAVEWLLG